MTYSATDLDDPSRLRAADPGDMLGIVERTGSLWRDGVAAARETGLPKFRAARAVAVCGVGGSGISGDVLAGTASTRGDVPVVVVKGFDLPRWVSTDTLVVCVSYSGDTEEAVSCFEEARNRGSEIVVVAGGGVLGARASETGVPWLRAGPPGLLPRAAFPSLAASLLVVGERAGLLHDLDDELTALLDACEEGLSARWGSDVSASDNDAKRIAAAIAGRHAHVWGQEGMLSVAAMRWKTQLNENAKANASWAVLPEPLHNEIEALADAQAFVVLRADVERERIAASIDALEDYRPMHARAIGTSDLATLASAVLLGDLVSVYVAALRGVDPSPIDAIRRFKNALGSS